MGLTYPKPTDLSHVPGLVAAYNMQPNGDTLVDISGNGNNGTISGAMSSVEGMKFNGDADEVDLGTIGTSNPLQLTGAFTIAFRLNANLVGDASQRIIDKSTGGSGADGWAIYVGTGGINGVIGLSVDGTNFDTDDEVIVSGKFSNVLVVNDGTSGYRIYSDGIERACSFSSGSWQNAPSVSTNCKIGTWNHNTGREYNGEIADIRIFNYAFSEQEAIDYHNQFAKQVKQRHAFDDLGVGSTIG